MYKILSLILAAAVVGQVRSQADPVNIYSKYKFMFNTSDEGGHARTEESNAEGDVSGKYQYVDPNGVLRIVEYKSSPEIGFQAFGDGIPRIGQALRIFPATQLNKATQNYEEILPINSIVGEDLAEEAHAKNQILRTELEVPNNDEQQTEKGAESSESGNGYLTNVTLPEPLQEVKADLTNIVVKSLPTEPEDKVKVDTKSPRNQIGTDYKLIYPPLFPYGFYNAVPISVLPFYPFTHTLPVIAHGFRYML